MTSSLTTPVWRFALLLMFASSSACGGTTTPKNSPAVTPSSPALAFAVTKGRIAVIGRDAKEASHLNVPGLVDGFAVRHPSKGTIILVGGDDRAWEVTLAPKLAARLIGKVALPKEQSECLGEGEVAQYMQAPTSIAFSKASTDTVCLTFSDRNVNMMDVEVTAALAIKGGTVKSGITYTTSDEGAAAKCQKGPPVCSKRARPKQPTGTWKEKDSCTLVQAKTSRTVDLRPLLKLPADATIADCDGNGAFLSGESKTGRFLGLMHDRSEGDYIHFTLTVFDMGSGKTAPKVVRSWSAVGETRVDWATSLDAVMIETTLVVLADKSVDLDVGAGGLFLDGPPRP